MSIKVWSHFLQWKAILFKPRLLIPPILVYYYNKEEELQLGGRVKSYTTNDSILINLQYDQSVSNESPPLDCHKPRLLIPPILVYYYNKEEELQLGGRSKSYTTNDSVLINLQYDHSFCNETPP